MSEPAPQQPPYGSAEDDDPLKALAIRRLKAKRDFRSHLVSYLLVNAGLFGIWLIVAISTGAWFPWFVFPALGWGIGLGFHAWAAYGPPPSGPTPAQIEQEMKRLRGQ
jgi:fatty acid desaturase